MTPDEIWRLEMIRDLLQKAFDETESFERPFCYVDDHDLYAPKHDDGPAGSHLVYVCMAISGEGLTHEVDQEEAPAFAAYLRRWYGPEHRIWNYVQILEEEKNG